MGYFPKFLIYVSSVIPMLAFYLIRIQVIGVTVFLLLCLLGLLLTISSQKRVLEGAAEHIKIHALDDKSGDIVFTLLSYMLIPTEYGHIVASLYMLFVMFVFFYSNIYFSNVFVAIMGIRCYSASLENGESLLLLIKGLSPSLRDHDKFFKIFKISDRIYLLPEGKQGVDI